MIVQICWSTIQPAVIVILRINLSSVNRKIIDRMYRNPSWKDLTAGHMHHCCVQSGTSGDYNIIPIGKTIQAIAGHLNLWCVITYGLLSLGLADQIRDLVAGSEEFLTVGVQIIALIANGDLAVHVTSHDSVELAGLLVNDFSDRRFIVVLLQVIDTVQNCTIRMHTAIDFLHLTAEIVLGNDNAGSGSHLLVL